MDIRIKSTGYEITPEVSAYLDSRIAAIEKMLADDSFLARCEVELGRDAGRPRHGEHIWFAEISLTYPGGKPIRATNRSESVNGAIDDVKEEVERQLRKEKKQQIGMLKRGGSALKRLMRLQ